MEINIQNRNKYLMDNEFYLDILKRVTNNNQFSKSLLIGLAKYYVKDKQ